MTADLLLVGAYIRRSDNAKIWVHRVNGAHEYVVSVDGVRVADGLSRADAMRYTR